MHTTSKRRNIVALAPVVGETPHFWFVKLSVLFHFFKTAWFICPECFFGDPSVLILMASHDDLTTQPAARLCAQMILFLLPAP